MTEKRFAIKNSAIVENGYFIDDANKKHSFPTTRDKSNLIMYEKALNEQHETIQQLQDKDIITSPQRHSKTATQDFLKRYTELLQYEDKVKETLQSFIETIETMKKMKGANKLVLNSYIDLIKHIADELGVELE